MLSYVNIKNIYINASFYKVSNNRLIKQALEI